MVTVIVIGTVLAIARKVKGLIVMVMVSDIVIVIGGDSNSDWNSASDSDSEKGKRIDSDGDSDWNSASDSDSEKGKGIDSDGGSDWNSVNDSDRG